MRGIVPNPRKRGAHVGAIVDYLRDIGATDQEVTQGKHIRIAFSFEGEPFSIFMAGSPRDRDNCADNARKDIRRAIRAKFPEARI